ncbi:alpha/beta hydrolase [Priestia flexa]|uniref:alpha/beta fold hydrolase n=1 Tax=Priestia flexa TaxID=86664 RepID=UPI0009568013|nr:alpha/beta hydrolase [Priestia flexa]MCP1189489.1 alpha/beta hydrolase [Priestia flexa]SIR42937.1 Pimeloyl-ACP methyl ester carboxylesterase [Priestia flexa]
MSSKEKSIQFFKEFIDIDGHQNGMFIETVSLENPVLLFLHGGPGFPQYPVIKQSGMGWEEDFTVCYLEQRGTGMSYNASTQGDITLGQLISDALIVTEYLKTKFKKEKIYLCGHSWGTFLGSIVVHRYPENYHAYIGIGQMGRHFESNKDTYEFLLETAIKKGDKKAEKDIRSVTFTEDFYKSKGYQRILGRYLNRFGGGTKKVGYSNWQSLKDLFSCRHYSWKERVNIPKGIFASYDALSEAIAKSDVSLLAPKIEVPVFIIHGVDDYSTSYREAKRFYEKLDASSKKLFSFNNCAHSPFIEDPNAFRNILQTEVLR